MKKKINAPQVINSISQMRRLLSLPAPEHPLISLINFSDIKDTRQPADESLVLNFYTIAIKKGCTAKMRYGQGYYDFDEGVMSFIAPGQVIASSYTDENPPQGWCLNIHPDFILNYPLAKTIGGYGFFSYAVNEALHLSAKEEELIEGIMRNIAVEYASAIDGFSQDVMVAQIDLLLTYANRFYNRQFITRKTVSTNLLVKVDDLLAGYFTGLAVREQGLPTVQYLSNKLNVSAPYLTDMLRSVTGQSTRQHIQDKLIEKAKEALSTTSLSVSEIAYGLGFEHPQSFNKLFKNKTQTSPLQFRQSFN